MLMSWDVEGHARHPHEPCYIAPAQPGPRHEANIEFGGNRGTGGLRRLHHLFLPIIQKADVN